MIFLDESDTGSKNPQDDEKNPEMLKEQERITSEIENQRLKIKEMREV
jgi:hypothetical protein